MLLIKRNLQYNEIFDFNNAINFASSQALVANKP